MKVHESDSNIYTWHHDIVMFRLRYGEVAKKLYVYIPTDARLGKLLPAT